MVFTACYADRQAAVEKPKPKILFALKTEVG